MKCNLDCLACNRDICFFDEDDTEGKHKPRKVSDKQKAYWEKRKKTFTKRQLEAIRIFCKYRNSGGDKSSKEYKQAYYIVRYLRDREKMLEYKKNRYKKLYLLNDDE